jgi:hypothetical protein
VATKSSAVAGLVAAGVVAACTVILHSGGPSRWDLFLNPFVPPREMIDSMVWVRLLFWNRVFLGTVAALAMAGTLWLLQRRERLL